MLVKKEDYIKSLQNVKLIIGNGFDLHCGLHTKYSDYYCKNYRKYRDIQIRFSEYEKSDILNFDYNDKQIKQWNTWDIFFALNSNEDPFACSQRWCDIETMILSSLIKESEYQSDYVPKYIALYTNIKWQQIEKCVCNNQLGLDHRQRFISIFIRGKMEYEKCDFKDFYDFLLDELKVFEKSFGMFIHYQIHDHYLEMCNYKDFYNEQFFNLADATIKQLCGYDNLVSVDSFNYTEMRNVDIKDKYKYINGNSSCPIFGIDTIFSPGDKRFIFTKTGRRMDSDLTKNTVSENKGFDNLVVYGHSLNEADYSYFFPLFDRLKLTDATSDSRIIFAYSIYDGTKSSEIKKEVRESVSRILYEYARDIKAPNPNRFLDSLTAQGRVTMLEIPTFGKDAFYNTNINDSWNKLYNEIKEIRKK